MTIRRALSLCSVILLAVPPLYAEPPPGRWEKVETLSPGTSIHLRLKSGDRVEGLFKALESDAIVVSEGNDRERTFPRSIILRIETSAAVPDGLRNGTLIGALVGWVGLAAMVAFAHAKTAGPVFWGDAEGPSYLLGAALVGGGIGAATGALIDASTKHHELLYRAR